LRRSPPLKTGLESDSATLGEPEKMDAVRRPCTIGDEMLDDGVEQFQCRGRVRLSNGFSELVEGWIPLKGRFFEIWDPMDLMSVDNTASDHTNALLQSCPKSKCRSLRKMKLLPQLRKGFVGVSYTDHEHRIMHL
jgi:hypothetical protein